ncbi:MAG: hypothetical protein ACR2QJ_15985 [Geminicoccaceae bacterium]
MKHIIDQKHTSQSAPSAGISEAERMAKIRELLVGPVIADESARVDQSVARLDKLAKAQHETIIALQARIQEMEDRERINSKQVRMRLLGMVEALLADDDEVRSRLMKNETLLSRLESDGR